jgi:hypothetical protein
MLMEFVFYYHGCPRKLRFFRRILTYYVQLMGQGEHQMEVLTGQHIRLLLLNPACPDNAEFFDVVAQPVRKNIKIRTNFIEEPIEL